MFSHIKGNVYCIYVKIPNSPLKNTNAYLVKGNDRNLLIDTGECSDVCLQYLREGLDELSVDMNKTDIFLTHLHPDHGGLVKYVAGKSTRLFSSTLDLDHFDDFRDTHITEITSRWCLSSGMPRSIIDYFLRGRQTNYFHYDLGLPLSPVNDGDVLFYGGHRLEVIWTPGHTPGHLCLYDRDNKLFFSGDHVLFGITPNISDWHNVPDSLSDFIHSLVKVRNLDADTVLPGHRYPGSGLADTVDTLIEHHAHRIRELVNVIKAHPGLSAYDISGFMSWNIHASGGWDNFPIMQKPFAVHETCAHIDYLLCRRQIEAVNVDGVNHYYFRRLTRDDILDLY